MSNNLIQNSFNAGELSPSLYARVDLPKYKAGAALLYNFFVDYRGGTSNRAGTEYVCRGYKSEKPIRLIRFQFSTTQTYVLEFGDFYLRVIKNGAQVLEAAKTISAITQANPGVVTSAAHGYAAGDQVVFNVQGMTQLNQEDYFVFNPALNTFQLQDWDGNTVNTAGFGAFTSGTVSRVYSQTSPYAAEDLELLKFTQSADVMTLTHPNYAPRTLDRGSDTQWTFLIVTTGASISPPAITNLDVTPNTAGTTTYTYVVTGVNAAGEESVASPSASVSSKIDISATAGSVKIAWSAALTATKYNVYKALPVTGGGPSSSGLAYGYMTTSTSLDAVDANIVPDFTTSPPLNVNPFAGSVWPGCVTYFQQRLVYAGATQTPETFIMSRPGQFKNFDVSSPVVASDAITGTLVSSQVNAIQHMVTMPGGLIMLTTSGAWQVSGGGQNSPVTPLSIIATPQAYNGCSVTVPPLIINYDILYVQQKGNAVRDLAYSFNTNIYTGEDISLLANHLFTNYQVKEWDYAEEPFKIVWAVRSDGACLSLTYMKEQQVYGWAQHHTQGRFKSVCCIQEGTEDFAYFSVQRHVQGQLIQFIERMHTRKMPYGAEDAWFVDCGLSNELLYPAATLQFSASTGDATVTADAAIWSSGDLGWVIRAGGGICSITSYIDPQTITVTFSRDLTDVDYDTTPEYVWPQVAGAWSMVQPFMTFEGLTHLEGQTVSILADGSVVPPQVVTNGKIFLSQPCSKVVVGLAYKGQVKTLYLDTGEPTSQGKRKKISALTVRVTETRGLWWGNSFETMSAFKDRDLDTIGCPIGLYTGDQRQPMDSAWDESSQMCIEQPDPLPATILGVIPEVEVGDSF